MKSKVFLLSCAMCMLSMVACKDDDENIIIPENNYISISVVDGLDENDPSLTRAAYSGLKTTFENGDEIGVYAVQGTTVKSSNVKFTLTDGKWVPADRLIYNPDYTYYAYFPYVASPYAPNWSASDLDDKFSLFIADASNKFWKADQSAKANFSASNLMVSQGNAVANRTINFSMQHKRTLAILGNASNVFSYSTDLGTTYPVTMSFIDNIPYQVGGKNYFLMKPGATTPFGGLKIKGSSGKYIECDGGEIIGSYTASYSVSTDEGATYGAFSSTKPSWLSISDQRNDGQPVKFIATVNNTIKATSVLKSSSSADPNKAALEATCDAPVSNVDLSMVDNAGAARASRSTANCYLVHGAGTYKFPLVYGNAIKNGATNASSYHTDVSDSNVRSTLVNHADAEISDPWLKNNGVTVDGAELLWQDTPELITSVGVSGDYITFTVTSNKTNIREGNAVISAKSGSTIVWSWHIWVTTETFANSGLTAINTGSQTYNVTPVNIGWVKPTSSTETYAGARCKVKLDCNGASFLFEVAQTNVDVAISPGWGHCTFYQWGRPIAEPGSNGAGNTVHPVYGISGATALTASNYPSGSNASVSIGTNLQNPTIHYWNGSNYTPWNEYKYNYWDMNQNQLHNITTHTVKTVYDPCPADFCVPTGNLYCYMGNGLSNPSRSNSRSDSNWDNTNKTKTWTIDGVSLVFPASGCRNDGSVVLGDVGSGGYAWSASAGSSNGGRCLYFASSYWYWDSGSRSLGFPVRAVAEN